MVLTIWVPSAWLAALSFFLIGADPMLWTISTTTLRQAVTPGEMLGRVSAVIVTATYGSRPVGPPSARWWARYGAEACILVAALGSGAGAGDPDLAVRASPPARPGG